MTKQIKRVNKQPSTDPIVLSRFKNSQPTVKTESLTPVRNMIDRVNIVKVFSFAQKTTDSYNVENIFFILQYKRIKNLECIEI